MVTVRGEIDYETTPSYNLTVQATESLSGLSATTLVIIQVLVRKFLNVFSFETLVFVVLHQSFVSTAPPTTPHPLLRGRMGDCLAKVQGSYFSSVPSVQRKLQGFDIRILTPGRFSIAKGGAKSKVLTSSFPPGGGAYSRALKAVKS